MLSSFFQLISTQSRAAIRDHSTSSNNCSNNPNKYNIDTNYSHTNIPLLLTSSSSPRPAPEEWENVDDFSFDSFPVEESSSSPSSTQSPFTPSPPEEIGREELTNEFADSRNSSDFLQKMGLVDSQFIPFLAVITILNKIQIFINERIEINILCKLNKNLILTSHCRYGLCDKIICIERLEKMNLIIHSIFILYIRSGTFLKVIGSIIHVSCSI
jgi:hypothetical protein